jgi:hypothetical protein
MDSDMMNTSAPAKKAAITKPAKPTIQNEPATTDE